MNQLKRISIGKQESDSTFELNYFPFTSPHDSDQEIESPQKQTTSKLISHRKINLPLITTPLPRSLKVIQNILLFLVRLRRRAYESIMQNLSPRIFSILNDRASDFDFFFHRGYFKVSQENINEFRNVVNNEKNKNLLMPDSNWKLLWDTIILVFTIINLIQIPFRLAFPTQDKQNGYEQLEFLCNYIPWALCILEVPITLNTAFYHEGHLHVDRQEIRRHYIQGYFYRDALVILIQPFGIFLEQVYLLVWFIRVGRMSEYISKVELATSIQQKYTLFWELSKLVGSIVFVNHFVACAWRYFALMEEKYGVQENWVRSKQIYDTPWQTQYIYSFYWSTITSTTVGYGDIGPVNEYEMLFVIFMIPIMLVLFGWALDEKQGGYLHLKNGSGEQIYSQTQLGPTIIHENQKLFRLLFEKYGQNEDEATNLMDQLHDDLKQEVNEQVYRPIIHSGYNFLTNLDEDVKKQICQHFKYRRFMPGQKIFSTGDLVSEMMFITQGKVQLYIPREDETSIQPEQNIRFAKSGEVIAEMNFLLQRGLEYNIRAIDFTEVVLIPYDDFQKCLKKNKDAFEKVALMVDNLKFNVDYQKVRKQCAICLRQHYFSQCPLAFYQYDREKILNIPDNFQKRRGYKRTTKKISSRQHRYEVIDLAVLYQVDNNLTEEQLVTEEYWKKMGLNEIQAKAAIILPLKHNENTPQKAGTNELIPSKSSKQVVDNSQFPSPIVVRRGTIHKLSIIASDNNREELKQKRMKVFRFAAQQIIDNNEKNEKILNEPLKENQRASRVFQPILNKGISKRFDAQSFGESSHKHDEDYLDYLNLRFNQLNEIKREYLDTLIGEDIIGFEKEQEYKYYYQNKNFSVIFKKRTRQSNDQLNHKRLKLKEKIKKSLTRRFK